MPEEAVPGLGPHGIAVMLLTAVALWAFTRDRLPLEITSLGLLVARAVGFSVFPFPGLEPTDFFHGL